MFSLGIVPYLNAVPITAELEGNAQVVSAVPSELGARLQAGEVHAALLPVYEALHGVGDGFLGVYGIASRGPVASVLLFLRCELSAVRTLVLDGASRTSAALARHLVSERVHGPLRIRTAAAPGPDPEAVDADAVLVIGDPALAAARRWQGRVLDLGDAWTRETGLPFVYARWTARKGLASDARAELESLLDRAGERGLARRAELARAWAAARGADTEAAARYVLHNVWYHLGSAEEAGLARYARLVGAAGDGRSREASHA
jgi:chorismate dehydratase